MKNKNRNRNTHKKDMVIVSLREGAFPKNGILRQEDFDRLAALKKEHGRLVLFTDRSVEEMMEGNILNACWDAFMVLDGQALCLQDLIPAAIHASAKNALAKNTKLLGRIWNLDRPSVALHVPAERIPVMEETGFEAAGFVKAERAMALA